MSAVMAVTMEERFEEGRKASGAIRPPEGGWGWMIVFGCFLSTICIRAVTRCVSMFFVEFQMRFEKDYSTTAWIHSLIDSTTMLCAPLGSYLGNRMSCRATVILGGLLSSAGLVLSSFASSLEFLYVSLGIITGLGFALSYTPAIAMVGKYFVERKALAYGIALSGSGIGTFLLAPAVQMLIEYYTWRGALLILGGFVSNLCVCGALMRPLEPKRDESIWENNMRGMEKAFMMTVLESKVTQQVTTDCSQEEPKHQEMHNVKDTGGLVIANGMFKNFGLESKKLQEKIILLPNRRLPDPRLTDLKIAECILLSKKLSETMLGETEVSDIKLFNDSTDDDLKLVKSMNSKNMLADVNLTSEDSGFSKIKPTDDLTKTVLTEPLVNTQPSSRGQSFCLEASKEFGFLFMPKFLILAVSFLFLAYGCSAPVVYLVPYALSVGVEHQHGAFLMSIFGVSGIVGNITIGWITDRKCLKKYQMLSYMVAIGMEGLCCMFVPFLHSFSLLVPFSALYGYFDGAYVALIPVVTSDTVGSTYLTSALGVVYFLHAIPYLISPPIGGWLVDRTGDYTATFFLSSASFILSSLILAAASLVKHVMTRCERAQDQEQFPQDRNQSESVPFFKK
ncbi:monocarboxylate transporter 12-B-like [Odontesthes bonariensis]|uniref:monocarboxylate transporter 12-B-like n=1 Tax=Odontesthes bonariensis TaxID=219752 RepID=UPI003F586006